MELGSIDPPRRIQPDLQAFTRFVPLAPTSGGMLDSSPKVGGLGGA